MNKNVVIIGGGAAGLAAAIAAAREGAEVTILEKDKHPGRKLLKTGNGRCNLTNTGVAPAAYNAPEFVASVIDAYGYAEIRSFFEGLGLMLEEADEGRVYPYSRDARSVLEVLLREVQRLGVKVTCDFSVIDIRPRLETGQEKPPFALLSQAGSWVSADNIVLATGSDFSLVPFLGHTKVKGRPVLCPLATDTSRIRGLSGVRTRCQATLFDQRGEVVDKERGELLFRDYGISGIMVFDLSRYAQPGYEVSIDFFPDMSALALGELLDRRREQLGWRRPADLLCGMLHPQLCETFDECVRREDGELADLLKDFRLEVQGVGDPKQAQVTRGGTALDQVDSVTLASKRSEGLFFAGEALDVDGRCGGFNLHWAWASGLVAGTAAARR